MTKGSIAGESSAFVLSLRGTMTDACRDTDAAFASSACVPARVLQQLCLGAAGQSFLLRLSTAIKG